MILFWLSGRRRYIWIVYAFVGNAIHFNSEYNISVFSNNFTESSLNYDIKCECVLK